MGAPRRLPPPGPSVFLLLALAAMAWGAMSFLHTDRLARAGFALSRGQLVVQVLPGSPAERSGIQVGDRITKIDEIPTRDRAAVARLSRGAIGDQRLIQLDRNGARIEVALTLSGLNGKDRWRRHARVFTGICFLLICAWPYGRRPGPESRALAFMGLGLGLAYMGSPQLTAEAARLTASVVRNGLILAGVGAGLHFLRLMAGPSRAARWHPAVIYTPLAAYWLLLSVRIVFAADTPLLIQSFVSVSGGLLLGIYLTIGMVTLARAWVRNRQAATSGETLRLLCLGPSLGLLPVAMAGVLPVLLPGVDLPGIEFWFLGVLLVPLSWARALVTIKD